MSADNGIYILETLDTHEKVGNATWVNKFESGIPAFRIAHAQGIDNLDWYEKNQPYNVGHYLHSVWGKSDVFYDISEAMKVAKQIYDELDICEYGICTIVRPQYAFPI